MTIRWFIPGLVFAVSMMLIYACPPAFAGQETKEADAWSTPTNGLQARIVLVEKPKLSGVRWIVPYLELRNVRDLVHPMEVRCDSRHVQFELVDSKGKPVTDQRYRSLERSGPVPDLGSVILPFDSSIRISMECRNWGSSKEAAMISTDSGAWVLQEQDKGQLFLRMKIAGKRSRAIATKSGTARSRYRP